MNNNKRIKSLTPEWLRKFPGCENYSETRCNDALKAISDIASILRKWLIRKKNPEADNLINNY